MKSNKEFSIMPDNKPIWRNFRYDNRCHRHEVFYGVRNREKSIEDGLVVFLPPELHNASSYGVHFNKRLDRELKQVGEKAWCDHYNKTIEEFRERYGKNYL